MCSLRASRNCSYAVFFLCFIIFCISFGVPHWYKGVSHYEGIWQSCVEDQGETTCEVNNGFGTTDPLIMGVQATMCIALASYLIAFVLYIVWLRQDSNFLAENGLTNHGRVALYCSAFGGVSNCMAVLVYGTDLVGVPHVSFDWGFLLAMISGALITLNAFITLCCVSREKIRNPKFITT